MLFRSISVAFGKSKESGLKRVKRIACIIVPMFVGAAVVLMLLNKPIVTLLFGDEYSNSSMILAPLCLWFVLSVVNNFLGIQILVASGHQKEYSNAFLISAVMSIVLYFILGKLLGMFGIAFATFFAELALTILLLIRVIKI